MCVILFTLYQWLEVGEPSFYDYLLNSIERVPLTCIFNHKISIVIYVDDMIMTINYFAITAD